MEKRHFWEWEEPRIKREDAGPPYFTEDTFGHWFCARCGVRFVAAYMRWNPPYEDVRPPDVIAGSCRITLDCNRAIVQKVLNE